MKKALITGGATGIGKATAQLFASSGYDTFITYNITQPDFDGVTAVKCDLANKNDIISLFKTVGDVDVVVNNGAVSVIKMINDMTCDDFDNLMAVNSRAVYLCCREAVKNMIARKDGAIINVSSMWGQLGASCETAYSMSKAGVIGLTKALAQEVAPSGITVNCVAPGIIDTRMNEEFDKKDLECQVPLERLGTPEEVAKAILFFAENRYVTSQVLGVNGGIC